MDIVIQSLTNCVSDEADFVAVGAYCPSRHRFFFGAFDDYIAHPYSDAFSASLESCPPDESEAPYLLDLPSDGMPTRHVFGGHDFVSNAFGEWLAEMSEPVLAFSRLRVFLAGDLARRVCARRLFRLVPHDIWCVETIVAMAGGEPSAVAPIVSMDLDSRGIHPITGCGGVVELHGHLCRHLPGYLVENNLSFSC